MTAQKIYIFYRYGFHSRKAGGIVTSLHNIINNLQTEQTSFVWVSTGMDLDGTIVDKPGISNGVEMIVPDGMADLIGVVRRAMRGKAVIYINGFMDVKFFLIPAIITKRENYNKVIVSPRGMLYTSAMAVKSLKKKIFLTLVKKLSLNHLRWHVTNETEREATLQALPDIHNFYVCANIPRTFEYVASIEKKKNKINLCTISLISPVKNIHLVLSALNDVSANISYAIYGSVKDTVYWKKCEGLIEQLPGNIEVTYRGEITGEQVPEKLASCHFFILPSAGENYGHAIVEALSAGRPVITSFNTPWNGLEENHAGFNVDTDSHLPLINAIASAAQMDSEVYHEWHDSAKRYIQNRLNKDLVNKQYTELFWLE